MDRLVIRDGELRGAIASVRASRNEFAQAVSRTDALQEAVGHRGLSGALQGFESRWSVRREKLVTSLEVIEKQLQGVLDTFGEWDRGNAPSQQSPGAGPTPTAPTAPGVSPAPTAPVAPAPGASSSAAPPPPSAPDPGAPAAAPDAAGDAPHPSAGESPSPEGGSGPEGEDTPVLPGSPEAINDLLDRLERLADTPAGLAALAGSVGALVVLMALFAPGSTIAPGLVGVDGARVKTLLERYTASTTDAFDGLTSTSVTPGADVDIEQQLDELEAAAVTEDEPSSDDNADVDGDVGDDADDAAEDEGISDAAASDGGTEAPSEDADDRDPEPVGSAPAAPQGDVGAGAPGSAPLADLPPPPDNPDAVEDHAPASSSAFDERFPDSPSGGWDDISAEPGANAVDVDAELVAMAGADADPSRDGAAALNPRMPMVAGGMGAMASASAGHAVTSAQGKGADSGNDDRLAAVRRELDELRATTEKEEKS